MKYRVWVGQQELNSRYGNLRGHGFQTKHRCFWPCPVIQRSVPDSIGDAACQPWGWVRCPRRSVSASRSAWRPSAVLWIARLGVGTESAHGQQRRRMGIQSALLTSSESEATRSMEADSARCWVAGLLSLTLVMTGKLWARRRRAMPRPIWPMESTATVGRGVAMAHTHTQIHTEAYIYTHTLIIHNTT